MAEGFSFSFNVLYGGVGIRNCNFLSKKYQIFFSAVIFLEFLFIPWIRIGIQPKMLDPVPDSMNLDLKY
jgi:hypothetical protein